MSNEKFTPGPTTEVRPGKEMSEYALQSAGAFMPHIAQNQYRDENVRTLAEMFEGAIRHGRKGYIKYRSLEAAAPDMYEALVDGLDQMELLIKQVESYEEQPEMDYVYESRDKIKAALSKAKGIIFIFAVLLISSCSRSVYSSTENNITVNGRIRQGIHIETVSVRRTTPNKL